MRALVSIIVRFWLPLTLAFLAAVTALSLSPLPELPLPDVASGDKLHHLLAYALLALPASMAGPRGWIWVALSLVAWSGLIELVQPFVNRHRELADMAANAGGVLIGSITGAAARRLPQ